MFSMKKANQFHIVLIKPSKYDDEGYVIRYLRGVLPSNTLACLHGLTDAAVKEGVLGNDVEVKTHLYDESVHGINIKKIARLNQPPQSKVLVALVGVQSNQFARAADLAKDFRKAGVDVMIGGFHVSGIISLFKTPTPEIQELLDLGVTIVCGEVEDTWKNLLVDSYQGKLQGFYNYLDHKPDMRFQPIPKVDRQYLKKFAFSNFATIDCGRGCPFNCSFCTIINVQGRTMRNRDAHCIINTMRENYKESKLNYYFFTDDNFSRNKNWEAIFDAVIELKETEGIKIFFMMQIDVLSYKIPNFIDKAKKAGCTQVFIGMESINPKNLEAVDKKQNKAGDYAHMINAWHSRGIGTHVGYIIGFPFDSPESIRADIDTLMNTVKVDQASFFMLTPLPGSMDHYRLIQEGAPIEKDYNRYDSFHATHPHPNFPDDSWFASYKEAWSLFYGTQNMKNVLSRANEETYWRIFMNFLWYKSSFFVDGEHPMISGFFRLKSRKNRRPGFPIESPFRYLLRRTRETKNLIKGYWALFLEMEEVWLATRLRSEKEKRLVEEWQILRNRIPHKADIAYQKDGSDPVPFLLRIEELQQQAEAEFTRYSADITRQMNEFYHRADVYKRLKSQSPETKI